MIKTKAHFILQRQWAVKPQSAFLRQPERQIKILVAAFPFHQWKTDQPVMG
ncbi:Uncharacterised protein [Vibrio cholerae]|nr:Uncharacterised protein [Vibrio cholerae]